MGWWWNQDQQALPTDAYSTSQHLDSSVPEPQGDGQLQGNQHVQERGSREQPLNASPIVKSREAQAYEELKSLFSQIDPQRAADAATRAKEFVEKPKEDYSGSIYASTMSCSQCFDQAYYCSSIGGQLNNVYRHGALRSCSDLWAQWRFCMRTKVMSEDVRQAKIHEFNQHRAARYKMGPSSEDVWELRREPLENPFSRSAEQ